MRKLLLNLFLVLFVSSSVKSQTPENKWSIGLNIGISEYSGDLGNGFGKFNLTSNRIYTDNKISITQNRPGYIGLTIGKYINNRFDMNCSALFGEEGFYRNLNHYYYSNFAYADITGRWKFLAKDNSKVTPYLMSGLGARYTKYKDGNDIGKNGAMDIVIPLGMGLNIKVEKRFYINVQSYYGWTSGDKVEGIQKYSKLSFDQLWHHSVGVSYLLNCK